MNTITTDATRNLKNINVMGSNNSIVCLTIINVLPPHMIEMVISEKSAKYSCCFFVNVIPLNVNNIRDDSTIK